MKAKELLISLAAAFLIVACDNSTPEPQPEPEPEPTDNSFDLSADEMANCYIVQSPGLYKFKADNMFNQGNGLPVPPTIHPESAKLVWQTVKSSISNVELDTSGDNGAYIYFEVTKAEGNALIAALDGNGKIVWSWHIWMPLEDVAGVRSSNGYEIMNMNLGALNSKAGDHLSYGMLYQWGRKDPFPAAATLTGNTQTVSAPMYDINNSPVTISNSSWYNTTDNNLAFAISNPTVCLSNYAQYATTRDWLERSNDALWGNPNGYDAAGGENKFPNKGQKTCYDPSPAGWRVAPADAFAQFTTSGGFDWSFSNFNVKDINGDGTIDINDYNYGWHFMVNDNDALYFPAAARFDGSYAMLMGSVSGIWGSYWSNSPNPSVSGCGFCALSFQVKDQAGNDFVSVSPSGAASKADAYSIRCIRDN